MAGFRPKGISQEPNDDFDSSSEYEDYLSSDASENKKNIKSLSLKITYVRYRDKDAGFFIAEGEPVGNIPMLSEEALDLGLIVPAKITVKGTSHLFVDNDQVGSVLDCRGDWTVNSKHGLQFEVSYISDVAPTSLAGLERFLCSGALKWIGPVTAKAMVDMWELDTIRILDTNPQRLLELPGITPKRMQEVIEGWEKARESFAVVSFLGENGINETLTHRIIDQYGHKSLIERIRTNPYMLLDVDGMGFKTADGLALSIGFKMDSPYRMKAALQYFLEEECNQNGHTAIPAQRWIRNSSSSLGLSESVVKEMCQTLLNDKKVVVRNLPVKDMKGKVVPNVPCVSLFNVGFSERRVALDLKRILEKAPSLTSQQEETLNHYVNDPARRLDESQKQAGLSVFKSGISVLTGGPGTGKTTTLRTIVAAANGMGWNVVLVAPTGRAAKRMEEAIGEKASTIHRGLKFGKDGFFYNSMNPMEGDFFVIDESSMMDLDLAKNFLSAVPLNARVLVVGDSDQLPSVGIGDILRDLIDSEMISVSRLTKVHRQAEGSGIAENAAAIREGKSLNTGGDPWNDDFSIVSSRDSLSIRQDIRNLIEGYLNQGFRHEDIQILTPQKNKDCGTEALNHEFRGLLNPRGPSATELNSRFCLGDRLMQIKNNYNLEVFNGDMGTVINVVDNELTMKMEDNREVKFPKESFHQLIYAYASTVHKSQGGERPVVIIPISREHSFTLNRSLVYTGVTRGKSRVCLVGSCDILNRSIKKLNQNNRITGLINEMAMVGLKPQVKKSLKLKM